MGETPYLFGDSDIAARRLDVLASTFAGSTRSFLAEAAVEPPRLAVDLGCGLGHTTHLLAEVLGCGLVVGLDRSERFIGLASRTATARVVFRAHDVTSTPFPTDPADLLYCRFLLTHLRDPGKTVVEWTAALAPHGLLLVEETEWIRTDNETYRTYLAILEAMLAAQSVALYVGRRLRGLGETGHMRLRQTRVTRLPVSNRDAATMFLLNLSTWHDQPFVRATYSHRVIEHLRRELTALIDCPTHEVEIEWGVRQVVCERI